MEGEANVSGRINLMLGSEFPLVAFSHCRDVVAAVSNSGGFGVLGVSGFSPEQLAIELDWLDLHTRPRGYGVDLLVPENLEEIQEGASPTEWAEIIPRRHRDFVRALLREHGVSSEIGISRSMESLTKLTEDSAHHLLDVAFSHGIGLIASALGVPPASMVSRAKEEEVPVAALVGAASHARRQAEAGVDLIIAQGYEAAGHTGEVGTMVLIPEVIAAVREVSDVPVLGAGGIVTGRQMAAAMALGAEGVWTGSVWLTTLEAETPRATQEKMLLATSRDTVRSKCRTGKYSRQLRSDWTSAWDSPDAPDPLAMPLQIVLSEPALREVDRQAALGHEGARALATYWVGQGVGLMNSMKRSRDVVEEFMFDYVEAVARMTGPL